MRARRFPIGLLLLSACGNQAEICDDLAVWSVNLTVVDAAGAALPDAQVTYAVDGEDLGACEQLEGAAWGCGVEVAGEFVITTTLAGYTTDTTEVTVAKGTCHVVGTTRQVILADGCDDTPHAAVRVNLSTQSGADVQNAVVEYRPTDEDTAARLECDANLGSWFCGWDDLSGSFEVYASADGFSEVTESVTVPATADGCHPDTQTVDLVFPDGG